MHRVVQFYKQSGDMIKVVVEDELEYLYLVPEHRAFGKLFQATQQQADTYKVEKLLIDNVDHTSKFNVETYRDDNRGQLVFYVKSKESVAMGDRFPINIFYKSSYMCPALDFFQSYNLQFPCKNFEVDMYLRDGLDKEYSIIASTNSIFSKQQSDTFKANEMKNFDFCRIKLQEWALPSDGYTATIKKKTAENH